eukprot:TRINITY_DN7048_c0_g1_i10.p1 TRINITY_DN7048_c0_g1~~TRINITY_DN7048_c0_g1_i10.p1  ORF type:complete len:117 (+),score=16.81 TRINITY_DN7048_c0_g1_i10:891-1241(+)
MSSHEVEGHTLLKYMVDDRVSTRSALIKQNHDRFDYNPNPKLYPTSDPNLNYDSNQSEQSPWVLIDNLQETTLSRLMKIQNSMLEEYQALSQRINQAKLQQEDNHLLYRKLESSLH